MKQCLESPVVYQIRKANKEKAILIQFRNKISLENNNNSTRSYVKYENI